MQTIRGWEVFCPIPWVEYQPDIGYFGTANIRPDKLELKKDYGHFDGEHYAIMSFYMDDYKMGKCEIEVGFGCFSRDLER